MRTIDYPWGGSREQLLLSTTNKNIFLLNQRPNIKNRNQRSIERKCGRISAQPCHKSEQTETMTKMTYLATKYYKLFPVKSRLNKIKRQVTDCEGKHLHLSIKISYSNKLQQIKRK